MRHRQFLDWHWNWEKLDSESLSSPLCRCNRFPMGSFRWHQKRFRIKADLKHKIRTRVEARKLFERGNCLDLIPSSCDVADLCIDVETERNWIKSRSRRPLCRCPRFPTSNFRQHPNQSLSPHKILSHVLKLETNKKVEIYQGLIPSSCADDDLCIDVETLRNRSQNRNRRRCCRRRCPHLLFPWSTRWHSHSTLFFVSVACALELLSGAHLARVCDARVPRARSCWCTRRACLRPVILWTQKPIAHCLSNITRQEKQLPRFRREQ